jgi:hypothetical protein
MTHLSSRLSIVYPRTGELVIFVPLPQIPMANPLQEHAFSIPVLSVEGDRLASHADDHAGLVSLMTNQVCSVHIIVRMRTYSAWVVLQSAYRRLDQLRSR